MIDNEYVLAIEKLKNKYPEYKDVDFELSDGELSYLVSSYSKGYIDMSKMQNEINDILGQKKYTAYLVVYDSCYARSEEEAREFINRRKPKNTHIDKIF